MFYLHYQFSYILLLFMWVYLNADIIHYLLPIRSHIQFEWDHEQIAHRHASSTVLLSLSLSLFHSIWNDAIYSFSILNWVKFCMLKLLTIANSVFIVHGIEHAWKSPNENCTLLIKFWTLFMGVSEITINWKIFLPFFALIKMSLKLLLLSL